MVGTPHSYGLVSIVNSFSKQIRSILLLNKKCNITAVVLVLE